MKFIWLGFIFELFVLIILRPLISDFELIGLIAILLHVIFSMMLIMSYKKKVKIVFLIAYLLRVSVMFLDLYGRDVFVLPHSGADSEMYYRSSLMIAQDLSLLGTTIGGMFSNIMGLLFYFIGPQRIVGQYINVLFGLSTIVLVNKILLKLNINTYSLNVILLIASFFPNSVILSSIFLREIIPTFFVSVSLYYFISWFEDNKLSKFFLTLVMLAIASMFHSGVIGISFGYFFGLLFYDRKQNNLKISIKTLIRFIMICAIIIFSLTYFRDMIYGKFNNVEEISDIYNTANIRLGGAAYLTSISITTPIQLLIFGPIKGIYFLTSPLPMNWRGLLDVITFLTDSIFYLFTIIYAVKNRRLFGEQRVLIICILLAIMGTSFVFGIGVGNAGTAMRHRQKLVVLFLVLAGLIMDCKRNFKFNFKQQIK